MLKYMFVRWGVGLSAGTTGNSKWGATCKKLVKTLVLRFSFKKLAYRYKEQLLLLLSW